jgi:hypothetical protein
MIEILVNGRDIKHATPSEVYQLLILTGVELEQRRLYGTGKAICHAAASMLELLALSSSRADEERRREELQARRHEEL